MFLLLISCFLGASLYATTYLSVNYSSSSCPETFYLKGMMASRKTLGCPDIDEEVERVGVIGGGFVKQIFLGRWRQWFVALSVPANVNLYIDDFVAGADNLKMFSPSTHIVQMIGLCANQRIIVTEYHQLGPLENLPKVMKWLMTSNKLTEVQVRLSVSRSYLESVNFLHGHSGGPFVNCDSNTLDKLLSQYALTDYARVVLLDVDALPSAGRGNVTCGAVPIEGSFVAPEQVGFMNGGSVLPRYSEKTDIWKVPDVVSWIMGDMLVSNTEMDRLFTMCKHSKAHLRPPILEILDRFLKINELKINSYVKP